jgi:hypothetical protein
MDRPDAAIASGASGKNEGQSTICMTAACNSRRVSCGDWRGLSETAMAVNRWMRDCASGENWKPNWKKT